VQGVFEEVRGAYALGEGDRLVAEFGLGVEEDGFVDEVLLEEGAVEVEAALEQEAEDVALGECGEDGGKAEASGVVGYGFYLGAEICEGGDFGFRSGLCRRGSVGPARLSRGICRRRGRVGRREGFLAESRG